MIRFLLDYDFGLTKILDVLPFLTDVLRYELRISVSSADDFWEVTEFIFGGKIVNSCLIKSFRFNNISDVTTILESSRNSLISMNPDISIYVDYSANAENLFKFSDRRIYFRTDVKKISILSAVAAHGFHFANSIHGISVPGDFYSDLVRILAPFVKAFEVHGRARRKFAFRTFFNYNYKHPYVDELVMCRRILVDHRSFVVDEAFSNALSSYRTYQRRFE